MKVKNIIAEALDLTSLQGQLVALKKSYEEMSNSVKTNPMLAKEYAPQLATMTASISSLEKQLGAMSLQQKTEQTMALKQQQLNQQNNTKPGTTQSLVQQGTPSAIPNKAPVPTAPAKPVAPVR